MKLNIAQIKVLNKATSANDKSEVIYVRDYSNILIMVSATSGTNALLKVKGTITDDPVDFLQDPSVENPYAYIVVKDYTTGDMIDGGDGIQVSSGIKIYELNVNSLSYITVDIVSMTFGEVSVTCSASGR